MKSLKIAGIVLGSVIGIAHVGVLGHLLKRTPEPQVVEVPTINIPHGPYTSYKITAGKEGYTIEYKANDPAVLESQRSLSLDKDKKGLFGGGTQTRREWRRDQYTAEGMRNIGGAAVDGEGKSAKDVECIVADAGARSQGAMAGSAVATGVLTPAVINIPYIGWLAAGWVSLLGNNIGSAAGSTVNSMISDC